jgi:hypothetical protein
VICDGKKLTKLEDFLYSADLSIKSNSGEADGEQKGLSL